MSKYFRGVNKLFSFWPFNGTAFPSPSLHFQLWVSTFEVGWHFQPDFFSFTSSLFASLFVLRDSENDSKDKKSG